MDRLIGVMDELLRRGTDAGQIPVEQQPAKAEPEPRPVATNQPMPLKAEERAAKPAARKRDGKAKTQPAPSAKPAQPMPQPQRALLQRIFLPDAERREAQSAVLAGNWWMVACRGVLAVLFGFVWLLTDTGYLNNLTATASQLTALYMQSLLVFLVLDGLLAIASGWRGATSKSLFLPLIMNGMVELLLGGWVVLQRLGQVRVTSDIWPPPEFWMDIGIGFIFAGALLLVGSSGLNVRYGRVWLLAAGLAVAASGVFIMLTSASTNFAWMGDIVTSGAGALLFVLALQLLARNREQTGRG
jgi:hypothetical protein